MIDVLLVVVAILAVSSGVFFLISIVNRYSHIDDFNRCQMELADRRVHEQQMAGLLHQLRAEVTKALVHEKEIFQALTPESAGLVVVQYPELQGLETVLHLLRSINQCQQKVYQHDLTYNTYVRRIKARQEMPWMFPLVKRYGIEYRNE